MKILNGSELASYIKERQAREVRALRQGSKTAPKLAIVQTKDDPVINTYVKLKKGYGGDISIDVDLHRIKQPEAEKLIRQLNADETIHGIIVQLPLHDPTKTDEIVNLVDPQKDVDALGQTAAFEPATPMAIMWLMAGYNIDLKAKQVLLVGRGKLVGAPLEKILKESKVKVTVADRATDNLTKLALSADVIITATGSPAVIHPDMIKQGAVVIDAGVASESGKTVGDLSPDVYLREDLTITPAKGGVGPLTVCALFENVIRSARLKSGVK